MKYGQWHLPFVPLEEQERFFWQPFESSDDYFGEPPELPNLIKFSAARCGWLSFNNHDKDGSEEAMLRTFERFVPEDGPPHGSPLEHQLTPTRDYFPNRYVSNVKGWLQARKLLPNEKQTTFEPSEEEITSWGEVDVRPEEIAR